MSIHFTNYFQKKAKKLCKKDSSLKLELSKQFNIFQKNHYHSSLRLHKLKGKRSIQYAIWIRGNLRALCIKNKDNYVFFDLISHDEY